MCCDRKTTDREAMATGLHKLMEKLTPKNLLLGITIIILLTITPKVWRMSRLAYGLYHEARWANEVLDSPAALELTQLQPNIRQTHLHLTALQKELAPFQGGITRLGWVPKVGGELASAPALLGMAVSLSEIADILLTDFEPVLTLAAQDKSVGNEALLAAAVEAMAQNVNDIAHVERALNQAFAHRANIDTGTLSPQLAQQLNRLDKLLPLAQLGIQFAPSAPTLLGAAEPKTYLIIAQNNDELRATGGFMTAIGTVTIENGTIINLTFEDSYAVDNFSQAYPEPPPQLLKYMQAEIWVFRDANWYPDFPASVAAMLDLYHISRSTEIAGIIAIDQIALQQIVAALEPVSMPGVKEPITGENVIDFMRLQWSPDEATEGFDVEWWRNRKNFMGNLVDALRVRIEQSPGSVDWLKLQKAVFTVLDERHVQVWLENEQAQALILEQGWAGSIESTTGDYLMVLDTNMGFNKADAVVTRTFTYEVALFDEEPAQATLTVQHYNGSPETKPCSQSPRAGTDGADYTELINRCYWDYLRVYAPLGSTLVAATPHAIDGQFMLSGKSEPARVVVLPPESEKSVWGTLLLVPHGELLETKFEYMLPSTIIQQTDRGQYYHLTVQKQAGTEAVIARVTVELPLKTKVLQVMPEPTQIKDERFFIFDLTLNVDREIEFYFE